MTTPAPGLVQPRVRSITRYEPSRAPQPIDLRLDANEGAPPPMEWLARVASECAGDVSRYTDAGELERALAGRFNVDPARVVVTAGADDALERVCRCVLGPGRTLALTAPTFEMIARYAALAGAACRHVPWLDAPFPQEEFCAALAPDTSLAYIASPNNPTGASIRREDLLAVCARAGASALLLLDLAYAEFADDDLTPLALELPNVVVTRTLSKAWGLAGMRVGWAIAQPDLASHLRRVGQPYAVSTLSLRIAARWLKDGASRVGERVRRIRVEREMLTSLLRTLGGEPLSSTGNFVLCRFPKAHLIADLLAGCGIGVRRFPSASLVGDCLRITCPGDEAAFDRLAGALTACARPQAILFDLDGVLAGVSVPSRRAFVDDARPAGLTTAHTEQCLADRLTLARLAGRCTLGIVTRRPRRDAERFLRMHALEDVCKAMVCMEDAPLRPDGASLRLVADRLGVRSAWSVGVTPEDVTAARAGGLVPIGCLAPGDAPAIARQRLLSAGAGVVLTSINDLGEILS